MFRELSRIINLVFLAGTAIGMLYPAFISDKSFTQILISLFHPEWSQEFAIRWTLFIGLAASIYVYVVGRMYRSIPLTVITNNIEFRFLDASGNKVEVHRSQLLRANQKNVTAYFSTHGATTKNGSIPKSSISGSVFCPSAALTDRLNIHEDGPKTWEVMHEFVPSLPYSWFMPLVPMWILQREYDRIIRPFRWYIAKRTQQLTFHHEFTEDEPVIQLISTVYPQYNLRVTLNFGLFPMPAQPDVRVRLIKNQGAVDVPFEYLMAERKVVASLDRFETARLRITWKKPLNIQGPDIVANAG